MSTQLVGKGARSAEGFTLVEMLVALAIIALVSLTLSSLARPKTRTLDLQGLAHTLVAHARAARASAIKTNVDRSLFFDLRGREFWTDGAVARQKIDEAVEVTIVTANEEIIANERALIRFFPDGSSSGASIALKTGTQRMSISIDWLTGAARVTSD